MDAREFTERFIAEARRAAAAIVAAPKELETERKAVARRLANWTSLAEREPGSPTILAQLRELEAEQTRVEQAIADAAKNAKVKDWLGSMKPAEARELIGEWSFQDAWTIEERRAALGALVERIEFDTATGKGRVHYASASTASGSICRPRSGISEPG